MDFNNSFNSTTDDTPVTRKDLRVFEEKMVEHVKKSEKKILKELQHNQDSIKRSLTRILQEAKQSKSGHKSSRNEVLPKKPFESVEDLQAFEKEIQDDSSKYEDLVENLSNINSATAEKFIKTAWRKILTDGAAQNLCWKGTNTKMAARALSVTAALKNSFSKKFPQSSDEEFSRTTVTFFQHAKGRLQKRTTYENNKNSSLDA